MNLPRLVLRQLAAVCLAGYAQAAEPMERGEYLYKLSGCENCHTDREHNGARFTGGRKLGTPLGTFYTPNITPDRQFGIGRWKRNDLVQYLESGIRTDGDCAGSLMAEIIDNGLKYAPDGDLQAIATYVAALPAVPNQVRKLKSRKTRKTDQDY